MDDIHSVKKIRLNDEKINENSVKIKIDNVLNKIFFHPCRSIDDLNSENNKIYNPYYAHHFFTDEEIKLIEGYETIIHIYYSCNWFDVYIEIDIIPSKNRSKDQLILCNEDKEIYINEIINKLKNVKFDGDFCTREEFIERIKIPLIWIPGITSRKWLETIEIDGKKEDIELKRIDLSETENLFLMINKDTEKNRIHPIVKNFQILHRRIEWFLHWYIESASSIDQEDRWTIWVPIIKNKEEIFIMGLITTYLFFSLPKSRLRISQVLIFPQYQGKGLGNICLDTIYESAINDDNIMEITIEDPAPSMMQLRDILTIEILIKNNILKKESFKPLSNQELIKILENPKKSLNVLKDIVFTVFPSKSWEEIKEEIRKYTKESPKQIERLLVLIAFFKYIPNPMPKLEKNIDDIRGLRINKGKF